MIVASIDIGTNTVILLIAEVQGNKIIPLYNEQLIPRIGKGLSPGKSIAPEKKNELMGILAEYKKKIDKFNCKRIIAAATNAFRIAANGNQIAKEIKERLNIDIKIVSGEEEAMLSFLGAVSGFALQKNVVVIDIGGGSSELIFGKGNEIFFKKSFPVGVVSSSEEFFMHDPPLQKEVDRLEAQLKKTFSNVLKENFIPEIAIAIAGTPTTLACIRKGLSEFNEEAIEGSFLTSDDLGKLIKGISRLKKDEILSVYKSVVKGREDVLLAGSIILFKIMNLLKLSKVIVSTKGIRYGAILQYLIKD
jgi:exopolyphosphatase/guanosine-5'-triphosphate,3'-diphosphate pyrophosphatase